MEFNAADIFEGVVDRVPDREAIVHGSTRLTYKELDARSNKAANALKKLGIKNCLLYTSPSPRDRQKSRMPSSA